MPFDAMGIAKWVVSSTKEAAITSGSGRRSGSTTPKRNNHHLFKALFPDGAPDFNASAFLALVR